MTDTHPVDDLFGLFDAANDEAQALVPAVRTLLDPTSDPACRAAAIAEIRASRASADDALRTISDDDADNLMVARVIFEAVLNETGAPDLVHTAHAAVERAENLGEHEVAIDLAERALAAAPESISLALLRANVHANRGEFEPARLEALCERGLPVGLRRRLHANLGVALLATGRIDAGLDAWRRAAEDASTTMSPDVAVTSADEPAWIQPMRRLLRLDGLGQLARAWGIGGPRMVVLLEGLASAVTDPDSARLLKTEAAARLRAGYDGFVQDPAEPHPTLHDLLEDAADFARSHGLGEIAARLSAVR